MNKIEKLIDKLCPEGVEWKTLGEVCEMKAGKSISASDISSISSEENAYPCFGGNGSRGYVNSYSHNGKYSIIGRQGALCGNVCFAEGKFYATEHAVVVKQGVQFIARFLYHLLLSMNLNQYATGGAQPGLAVSNLEKIKIPIPPLSIQEEIMENLDTFSSLEAELEAELEVRKNQYEYYRKELLTFGEDVEWKVLGEVYEFQYGEGNTIPTSGGEYPVYGSNGIVGSHSKYNSEDAPVIGHIGAYAGIVNWASGKHFVTYNGVICRIKKGINPRFGYHLLKKQNLRELAKDGSQPFVSYDKLKSVKVQVPNNDKQIKIVGLLDKFDALVNDISVGLPAELNARRKQYRYYRNKLLTFKPLEKEYAKQ